MLEQAGGGGVLGEGPLSEMLAASPQAGDLWLQDDDDGTADCASGSGSSDLLCMYTDAGTWTPAGIAASGLTNPLTADMNAGGFDIDSVSNIYVDEAAAAAADIAADGQIWVRNGVPNVLAFTDDAGTDFDISGDHVYYAVNYQSGSNSGGIAEAITACAATGGIVKLPRGATAIDGTNFTTQIFSLTGTHACDLRGEGSDQSASTATPLGGTRLVVTNSGNLTIFDITDNSWKLRDFTMTLAGADTGGTTTGIACGLTNNVEIANVFIDSDGTSGSGAGVGISMDDCLKAEVTNVETTGMATGLLVDGVSNATVIQASRFREGTLGVNLTGSVAEGTDFSMVGVTMESNERGMLIDGSASFRTTLINPHFEQESGTIANRYNLKIEAPNATIYGFGGHFGGTLDTGNAYDIWRTDGNAIHGSDVWIGGSFSHGIDYNDDVNEDPDIFIAGARGLTDVEGRVFESVAIMPESGNSCPTEIAASDDHVYGALCIESDGDVFACTDPDSGSGSIDGICDVAAEVTQIAGESGSYVWTGTHDFGGGTLEVPNSTTLPATCNVGESYMDTDATSGQRFYLCESSNTWALQGDGGSGSSAWTDRGSNYTSPDAHGLIIGGDEDDVCETGETCITAAGVVTADTITARPSATPSSEFTDSDTTDEDVSASIDANCTDTGTGAEDCDVSVVQQQAGAEITRISLDADGDVDIDAAGGSITLGDGGTTNYLSVSDGGVLSATGTGGIDLGSGTILGAVNIVTTTDGTESPTTSQMGGSYFIADHATAANDTDYTLPTAVAGMSGCFYDNGAGTGGIIIDAAAGDEILLDGTGVGVADAIDSPGVAGDGANGDFICLLAIDATSWITMGRSGTWVDGGAD